MVETEKLRVIRRGFDTLDVAFQGAVNPRTRAALAEAKERAAEAQRPVLLEIEDFEGLVSPNGASGGYAFIWDTGPQGEIWTFKDNGDPEQWNIRVQVRSAKLAIQGYQATRDSLFGILDALGAYVRKESISRADFAVDFLAENFEFSSNDFVMHSHATARDDDDGLAWEEAAAKAYERGIERAVREAVSKAKAHGGDIEKEAAKAAAQVVKDGGGILTHSAGRKSTSVTIGKMPGRQVIVYDKRREAIRKSVTHWFDVWGFDKDDCPPIWRVEIRAGKEHLRDWRISTFDDLEAAIGDVYAAAVQSVRLLARQPEPGENVSRVESHPLWVLLTEELQGALRENISGIVKGRITEGYQDQIQTMLRQQICGTVISYAVANGLTPEETKAHVIDILDRDMTAYYRDQPSKFSTKFTEAKERYHFLERVPCDGQETQRDGTEEALPEDIPFPTLRYEGRRVEGAPLGQSPEVVPC